MTGTFTIYNDIYVIYIYICMYFLHVYSFLYNLDIHYLHLYTLEVVATIFKNDGSFG